MMETMIPPQVGMRLRTKNKKIRKEAKKREEGPNKKLEKNYIISKPEDIYNLVKDDMKYFEQEHFRILMLNTKNIVININIRSVKISKLVIFFFINFILSVIIK